MQYSQRGDKYSSFRGSLDFKFINCFIHLAQFSEETCEEYCLLCEHIDTILPKIHFKIHQAYKFFHTAKEGLDNLNLLQPLREKIAQKIYWFDTTDLPPYLEFDYIYPNGKNGDVLKYILEEYGETNMVSGMLWHGKIEKEYISYLDLFYSYLQLSVSEDPRFHEIFKYHVPTILNNRLGELVPQNANWFNRFREYQNMIVEYSKEQTRKRSEVYSQVVLQGKTSPKWKSEAQLFALVSNIYPDAQFQYHAEWLSRQSLDIYIPSLSVGIEYQGIQHYMPIDHFGGEKAFIQVQKNDIKKKLLCKENGVYLIDWPYTESITEENVKKLVEKVGNCNNE